MSRNDDDDDDKDDDDKVVAMTTTISSNGRLVGLNDSELYLSLRRGFSPG